jgi:hypothetical protein
MTAEAAQGALVLGAADRILPLGVPALDAALPQQGLALGRVIELQVQGPSGAATSFALCACRAAQRANFSEDLPSLSEDQPKATGDLESAARNLQPADVRPGNGRQGNGERNWCAFIDPGGTLFAPGLARLGIDLSRLLVVRPTVESVGRTAVRIVEANIAAVVVIDLRGALSDLSSDEHAWQRTIRRLSLALESTTTCVLLITRAERRQSLPLPTFLRLQFTRSSREFFQIRVVKDRTGRSYTPQTIPFSAFGSAGSAAFGSAAFGSAAFGSTALGSAEPPSAEAGAGVAWREVS